MQLCELEVELYGLEADLCVLAEVWFQSEVRYYELAVVWSEWMLSWMGRRCSCVS